MGCCNPCKSITVGLLGCRWKASSRSTGKTKLIDWCFFALLVVAFILNLIVMYSWIITKNDEARFNWGYWDKTGREEDMYSIILVLSIIFFVLTSIALTLAVIHFIFKQQLYIHWANKVLIFILFLYGLLLMGLIEFFYSETWTLLGLSMKFLAPFFQICAVIVITFLTWLMAGCFALLWYKDRTVSCIIATTLYFGLLMLLYLSPLAISSPCVLDHDATPRKPLLLGHRGAERVAPENTIASFVIAIEECQVFAIESDCKISYDGVPFMVHDDILTRVTNVAGVFPQQEGKKSSSFMISELKQLDAGSWFLEDDPFGTTSSLSAERVRSYRNQTIPTLAEVLELTNKYNLSFMFDARPPPEGHPYDQTWFQSIRDAVEDAGISADDFYYEFKPEGDAVVTILRNDHRAHEEVENYYVGYDFKKIKSNTDANIWTNTWSVNLDWMLSLYWCASAPSITTNDCHGAKRLKKPLWMLTPNQYLTIWLIFDCVSAFWVIIIFIVQFRRGRNKISGAQKREAEMTTM
ncbi:glycerophosphodiester phosphodiesterase domain-containing protein 5-like isoform X2 [Ptychodera flava]|uniref:glycerophosphodiester phosphodiesterase domain-containing protein 5-like isoform X2 n=2 Tax=Ptychodera flava TaxID=63121 RepID=UPI003969F9A5